VIVGSDGNCQDWKDGPGAERDVLYLPHHVDCVHVVGLDVAPNAALPADDGFDHRAFVVRAGLLVRLGLLSVHGVALAGAIPFGFR
jgi:hypothetical protein